MGLAAGVVMWPWLFSKKIEKPSPKDDSYKDGGSIFTKKPGSPRKKPSPKVE